MKQNGFLSGNDYFFVGLFSIGLSAVLFFELKDSKFDAALVPRLVCFIMLFLGAAMLTDSYMKYKKKKKRAANIVWRDFFSGIILPGVIVLAGGFLARPLGFYLAAFLVIGAIFYLQDVLSKKTFKIPVKRFVYYLIFAFGVTAFMYVMFHVFLGLPTPIGIFGF